MDMVETPINLYSKKSKISNMPTVYLSDDAFSALCIAQKRLCKETGIDIDLSQTILAKTEVPRELFAAVSYDESDIHCFSVRTDAEEYIKLFMSGGAVEPMTVDDPIDKMRVRFAQNLHSKGLKQYYCEVPIDGSPLPDKYGLGSSMFEEIVPREITISPTIRERVLHDAGGHPYTIKCVSVMVFASDEKKAWGDAVRLAQPWMLPPAPELTDDEKYEKFQNGRV